MPTYVTLETPGGTIDLDRTRIMGVLNVTPDSFHDGGLHFSLEKAYACGMELEQQGADIIDVGGESTRPGSARISEEEESARVAPVVERLAAAVSIPISVDTYKSGVARRTLDCGAAVINDVTALRGDPEMVGVVASAGVPVVLMHSLWPPETMQQNPEYVDVVEDVAAFIEERARLAVGFGVSRDKLMVDPGIGFGKTLEHNLALLRGLPRLMGCGYPLLVGPSRKSFIGTLLDKPSEERLFGTAGVAAICAAMGVQMVRVHDVAEMKDVVRVVDAIVWQV